MANRIGFIFRGVVDGVAVNAHGGKYTGYDTAFAFIQKQGEASYFSGFRSSEFRVNNGESAYIVIEGDWGTPLGPRVPAQAVVYMEEGSPATANITILAGNAIVVVTTDDAKLSSGYITIFG